MRDGLNKELEANKRKAKGTETGVKAAEHELEAFQVYTGSVDTKILNLLQVDLLLSQPHNVTSNGSFVEYLPAVENHNCWLCVSVREAAQAQ